MSTNKHKSNLQTKHTIQKSKPRNHNNIIKPGPIEEITLEKTHQSSKKMKIDFTSDDITEKLGNSKIFCREVEKKEIISFIKSKEKNKKTLFISGQPGTGKTSLINEIYIEDLKTEQNYFLKFAINCLSINSTEDFYESIFKFLNAPKFYNYFKKIFDDKTYNVIIEILKDVPCEDSFLKLLTKLNKTTFLILLDEIDFLYKKADDYLFFSLLSIPYLMNSDVKMILISNNSDFDNEIFPKLKNRKIQISKIIFKPYTHKQLAEIMLKKLEILGFSKNFSNDAVRFLSTKMNKSGDIRPIMNIIKELLLNNKKKLQTNSNFKIELKDMFDIIKKKNINLNEILSSLTTEQKIIVAAMYYVCKEIGIKMEEKTIFNKYKNIKNYTNTPLLNTEEFRTVLKTFVEMGLMELTSFGGKRKKSTILYKLKYSDDDLALIFEDPMIYSLFNSNQDEEDQKIEKEFENK